MPHPTATPSPSRLLFDLQLNDALDQVTGSCAREGNRVRWLFDGAEAYPARHRWIDAAQSSIHLQTFTYWDDLAGWDLASRLARRARDGIEVRVIYDGAGSRHSRENIFDFMRDSGVEVRKHGSLFRNVLMRNSVWHEKHFVVDGRVAIEGGLNVGEEYAFGGTGRTLTRPGLEGQPAWRDVDVEVEGPVVQDIQLLFLSSWAQLGPSAGGAHLFPGMAPLSDGIRVRAVSQQPDVHETRHIQALYLDALDGAQATVKIENPYILPNRKLERALVGAAQRGVEVQVLTNSLHSSDVKLVSEAAQSFHRRLVEAGVHLYERTGPTLHSKTMCVDGRGVVVGSANLNGRSHGRDGEFALTFEDPALAEKLQLRFEEGLRDARTVTLAEWSGRRPMEAMRRWALSSQAWTL